jgi:hypothetical protein
VNLYLVESGNGSYHVAAESYAQAIEKWSDAEGRWLDSLGHHGENSDPGEPETVTLICGDGEFIP